MLVKDFGGNVPDNIDDLLKLPGVGRKTANAILANAFGQPAIVVDTHTWRLSQRLGLTHQGRPRQDRSRPRQNRPTEGLDEVLSPATVSRAARLYGKKPEMPELFDQQTLPVAGEDEGVINRSADATRKFRD